MQAARCVSQAGEGQGSSASGPWEGHSCVGGLHGGLRQPRAAGHLEALAMWALSVPLGPPAWGVHLWGSQAGPVV